MKYSLYFGVGLVVLFVIFISFDYIGYNAFGILVPLIEWGTKFILPWIALYWFIQFVKNKQVFK
ncbi:hypothetical protein ACERII_09995 [Evansella sp. AB-rgal1]|uniref:hypothetical protein n=1 Tax=Evansella sp. AB-rgal1 TaxID=3242696 RepID=UPI00359E97B2